MLKRLIVIVLIVLIVVYVFIGIRSYIDSLSVPGIAICPSTVIDEVSMVSECKSREVPLREKITNASWVILWGPIVIAKGVGGD